MSLLLSNTIGSKRRKRHVTFSSGRPVPIETGQTAEKGRDKCLHVRLGSPLKDDKGDFPLTDVVVGPNPNPQQAYRSVQSLLNSEKGLDSVKVRDSDIPYRNW
jgi:hypothetical protein